MNLAQTIDAMMAADCTREQMAAVVRGHQAQLDKRAAEAEVRTADRLIEKKRLAAERQRKWRMAHPKNNESNALPRVTEGDGASPSVSSCDNASNARAPVREEVLTYLDSNLSPTKSPPKGGQKGKVLSPDWQPSDADRSYAISQGLTGQRFEREIENFRDYWLGRAGGGAAKRDWSATWRTWVRRALERTQSPPARAGPNGHRPRTMTELARMDFSDEPSPSPQTEPESPKPAEPTVLGFAGRLSQPDRDQPGGKLLDLGQAGARWRA